MFRLDIYMRELITTVLATLLLILTLLTIGYVLGRESVVDNSDALRDCRLRGQVDRHWCEQQLSKCDERWD